MTVTDETCIAKIIRRAYWFYAKVEVIAPKASFKIRLSAPSAVQTCNLLQLGLI
jgi:hypothetical protein